jgi:glycosyltransferase involved in cell wall biosynthesis
MFGRRPFVVIPNGIDLARFRQAQPSPIELPPGAKVMMTTAGYRVQKNPLFLVDVMAAAARRCPRIVLLWCGSGGLEDEIKARIAAQGLERHIVLLGNRSDVASLLRRADCFVLPSRWEGFGIALVEAQAAGVPCLASTYVPRSTDCGLCTYLPLEEAAWVEAILAEKKPQTLDFNRLNRYDIQNTCAKICVEYKKIMKIAP